MSSVALGAEAAARATAAASTALAAATAAGVGGAAAGGATAAGAGGATADATAGSATAAVSFLLGGILMALGLDSMSAPNAVAFFQPDSSLPAESPAIGLYDHLYNYV